MAVMGVRRSCPTADSNCRWLSRVRETRSVMALNALAALRTGAPTTEIAFCFLEQPEAPVTRRYGAEDAEALAGEVRAAIGRLRSSAFVARAGDHCATCPALDRLCPAPGWREREPV